MRNGLLKTVAGLVAGLCLSAPLGAAPAAHAALAGNIVTLGDSYTSNPDQIRNALRGIPIPAVHDYAWDYPSRTGCLQAPNNWPRKLEAKTGLPLADWSCTAQTSQSVLSRLDRAIAAGDIHPGTRAVILSVGINDYGPSGVQPEFQPWNPATMTSDYVSNIQSAAKRIRSAAPGTKIIVSGMISVSSPFPPHMFCPLNVVPNAPAGFPLPQLQGVEAATESNQRAAAAAAGATFADMRMPSANHGTCAPDGQRYVAGAIDTTTPSYNMNLHPSDLGSEFIADRLTQFV